MPSESISIEFDKQPPASRPTSPLHSSPSRRWPRLPVLFFLAFVGFVLVTTAATTAAVHFGVNVADVGKIQILPALMRAVFVDGGCLPSQVGCTVLGNRALETEEDVQKDQAQAAELARGLKFRQKDLPSFLEDAVSVDPVKELTGAEASHVWHTMSDSELFAAALATQESLPADGAGKVALMFLTRGVLPLAPLWTRFLRGKEGRYSVYVHAHPNYTFAEGPDLFRRRRIPSQPVSWGSMAMVDAERRLLANALLDPHNHRFLLLSESCAPIASFDEIYDYIINTNVSFIEAVDDPTPQGRGRYHPGMQPEITVEQWRKGRQWFEVTRRHARAIVNDTLYYTKFLHFCRDDADSRYCYPDEHYLQTWASITLRDEIAHRSLTYVDWSRGGWHPATFGFWEATEEWLRALKARGQCDWKGRPRQCFLFVRKVDRSALRPLMQMNGDILGYR